MSSGTAVMTLLLILLAHPSNADQVLARYTRFVTSANTLSVQVKAHPGGDKVIGTGSLAFERPAKLAFNMTAGTTQYLYTLNGDGGTEQDRGRKLYDEFPSPGGLSVVASTLSSLLAIGLPYPLLRTDLHQLVPQGTVFNVKGKVTIGGVTSDVVSAHYSVPGMTGDVVATIDPKGRLIKITVYRRTQQGSIDLRFDMSNYVVNAPIPASRFSLDIPKGYVPWSMPSAPDPVTAGDAVPLGKWSSTSSENPIDLASLAHGKPALVVVADADSGPCASMLKAIASAAQKTKDKGGVYAVVSTAKDKATAQRLGVGGTLYDPTGSQLSQLRLPGTPLVYLVGRDGKLVQAWFGYDSAADAAFQKELTEALAKAGVK